MFCFRFLCIICHSNVLPYCIHFLQKLCHFPCILRWFCFYILFSCVLTCFPAYHFLNASHFSYFIFFFLFKVCLQSSCFHIRVLCCGDSARYVQVCDNSCINIICSTHILWECSGWNIWCNKGGFIYVGYFHSVICGTNLHHWLLKKYVLFMSLWLISWIRSPSTSAVFVYSI